MCLYSCKWQAMDFKEIKQNRHCKYFNMMAVGNHTYMYMYSTINAIKKSW